MADAKTETVENQLNGTEGSETQTSQPKEAKKPEEGNGAMPSQSPAELQKELDAKNALIEKLRKNEDQAKKDAKRLKELEDADAKRQQEAMSESEKVAARIKELEQANAEKERLLKEKERQELQRKVAKAAGLPDGFAERLRGDTEEELQADAKIMLELLPKQEAEKKTAQPKLDITNPGDAKKGETLAQKKARIMGTPGNVWDGANAKARGGGVVFVEKE